VLIYDHHQRENFYKTSSQREGKLLHHSWSRIKPLICFHKSQKVVKVSLFRRKI
jgi:hypothetical protein